VLFLVAGLAAPLASPGAEDKKAKEEPVPLKKVMEEMSSTLRQLRRQVKDPAKDEATLQAIAAMEQSVVKAKSTVPPSMEAMPQAKQAEALRAYRLRLVDVLTTTLAVEKAVLESRHGEAAGLVAKLELLRDECHKTLGIEE
jgi:hypothetical protein